MGFQLPTSTGDRRISEPSTVVWLFGDSFVYNFAVFWRQEAAGTCLEPSNCVTTSVQQDAGGYKLLTRKGQKLTTGWWNFIFFSIFTTTWIWLADIFQMGGKKPPTSSWQIRGRMVTFNGFLSIFFESRVCRELWFKASSTAGQIDLATDCRRRSGGMRGEALVRWQLQMV